MRCTDDDKDGLRVGENVQDALDQSRRFMVHGHCGVVGRDGAVAHEAVVNAGQQHRRAGKKLVAMLLCK